MTSSSTNVLFPWLVYLAKFRASVHLPNVCLFPVTAFPRLVYVGTRCAHWYLLSTDKVISQVVKYKRVVGTQQVSDLTSRQRLVYPFIWVTFAYDLWETGKLPKAVQVLCSHYQSGINKWYVYRMYELWESGFRCGFYPLLPAVKTPSLFVLLFSYFLWVL